MSTALNKNRELKMDDVLEMISGFETGNFSKTLSAPDDHKLKPLVDKLNSAAKILAAQAAQTKIEITERKQAEEALRRSEAEVRAQLREIEQIYAYSPCGLFIFDREYRFQRINEHMAEINGFSVEHHVGKTLDEIAPDLAGFLKEVYRPIFERGEPVLNVEIHGNTPRDTAHECHWIGNYFPLKSETGEVIGLIGAVLEITERKTAENEKETIQKRLNYALDASGDGIWDWTPADGRTVYSKAWIEMIGYEVSELASLASEWSDRLHPDDVEWVFAAINKVTQTPGNGDTLSHEYRFRNKAGHYLWILNKVKVVERNEKGEATRVVGTHTDITERKTAEAELNLQKSKLLVKSRLESLGEMSAGIAHEINNPLAIISGSVGLLSKFKDNPEKLASKIDTIKKSCERISRIVQGLKKLSRSGDKSDLKTHDLCNIVKEVSILIDAKSKRHSAPVTIECDTHAHVLCDEVEIEQVLVNLINNAIDAIKDRPEKWVKVALYDDGNSVVLRVTDSGSGIPENVRNKLFEPFFTTKKVGEGTGLGLSITKGILDEHKATITVVADSPNTCFEIKFPKAEVMKNVS